MDRKNLPMIIMVAVISAIISFVIAGLAFRPPPRGTKVPQAEAITATFPDVKNDANYSSFLNPGSLDPTQPVQIGGSQNTNPF
jgi:hypothetical protein